METASPHDYSRKLISLFNLSTNNASVTQSNPKIKSFITAFHNTYISREWFRDPCGCATTHSLSRNHPLQWLHVYAVKFYGVGIIDIDKETGDLLVGKDHEKFRVYQYRYFLTEEIFALFVVLCNNKKCGEKDTYQDNVMKEIIGTLKNYQGIWMF